jgi:hypothetical protein
VSADDVMGYNFPLGSGVNTTITVVDATQSNAGGNMLQNSDFETAVTVPNVPDSWNAVGATPGTDLKVNAAPTGVFLLGDIQFVANSGTTPGITQVFAAATSASGTTATLSPDTQYAVSFWGKKSAGLTTTGVLTVDLINGSNTVIADDAGTNNAVTVTASTLSSSAFTNTVGFFRTPAVLPSTVKVRVWMSTAIGQAAQTVDVGGVALTPVSDSSNGSPIYTSGPNITVFAGPSPFYLNDRFTVAINNNYAGVFQVGLDKFLNLRTSGKQIPSAVSPTIADSLVS